MLFTFITGLLVNGPITGIIHNFSEVSKNTACVYKAVARMAKSSLLRLNDVFGFIEQLRNRASDPFDIDPIEPQPAKPTPKEKVSVFFGKFLAIFLIFSESYVCLLF